MAHGAVLLLAFPPVGLWWMCVVLYLPLVVAAERLRRDRAQGRSSKWFVVGVWLGTVPAWVFHERWMVEVTPVGFPLLACYLSVYGALVVLIAARVRESMPRVPAWVVYAALFGCAEVLRGEVVLYGYPWYLSAQPLIEWPALARAATSVGAYGVGSLLTAIVCALSAGLVPRVFEARSARWTHFGSAGLLAAAWLAASSRTGPEEFDMVRVGVVQTNVPQDNRVAWEVEQRLSDFARFSDLTRVAASAGAALIVWPETMFPGDALNMDAVEAMREVGLYWEVSGGGSEGGGEGRRVACTVFADEISALQQAVGVPMLVGAASADGLRYSRGADGSIGVDYDARHNSTFVLDDGRVAPGRYDKLSLVPFGEVIPYAWRWKGLSDVLIRIGARGMTFSLAWGKSEFVHEVGVETTGGAVRRVRIATPICFEGTMTGVCRRLAAKGGQRRAELLVNQSNDGWFSRYPGGRENHLLAARWRCVEHGLWMVRAVNTGVSCVIDADGRVRGAFAGGSVTDDAGGGKITTDRIGGPIEDRINIDGVLLDEVGIARESEGATAYARGGWLIPWTLAGLGGVLTAASVVCGRRAIPGQK